MDGLAESLRSVWEFLSAVAVVAPSVPSPDERVAEPRGRKLAPSVNIATRLHSRQLTSRRIIGCLKERRELRHHLDKSYHDIPAMIHSVDIALLQRDWRQLSTLLMEVLSKLREDQASYTSVLLFEGAEAVLRVLQTFPQSEAGQHRVLCVMILKELCIASFAFAETLGERDDLIVFLFGLLREPSLFEKAVGVLEELLNVRRRVFDLTSVPAIGDITNSLSSRQLIVYCRLLAATVHEIMPPSGPDTTSNISYFKTEEGTKRYVAMRAAETSYVERNQGMLIGLPHFLPRLVKLLSISNSPGEVHDMPNQAPLVFLQNQNNVISLFAPMNDRFDWDPMDSIIEAPDTTALAYTRQVVRILTLTSHQEEVIFVLCCLLSGQRKEEVQRRLVELGFVPILCAIWARLKWNEPPATPEHGPGCRCSPESSLKTQFLRLLHHFVEVNGRDAPSLRQLLLTRDESVQVGGDVDHKYDSLRCTSEGRAPGVFAALVRVFMAEPPESRFCASLASCVEAYLRGATAREKQFVMELGLMRHLFDGIMQNKRVQSSFDLLGEILKFNRAGFAWLSTQVPAEDFETFIGIAMHNLIDSNVFLRSCLLSMDRFAVEDTANAEVAGHQQYNFSACKVAAFLRARRIDLLQQLMVAVDIDDISQDNMCCLNTALVIMIFARSKLPHILKNFRDREEESGRAVLAPFRELVKFFKGYYGCRAADAVLLEASSGVSFKIWDGLALRLLSHGTPWSLERPGDDTPCGTPLGSPAPWVGAPGLSPWTPTAQLSSPATHRGRPAFGSGAEGDGASDDEPSLALRDKGDEPSIALRAKGAKREVARVLVLRPARDLQAGIVVPALPRLMPFLPAVAALASPLPLSECLD